MHHSDAENGKDSRIAACAAPQHGVISRAQLTAVGVGRGSVARRIERGSLHRVHRGVYAVGHPHLTWRAWLWAAVLACGGPEVAGISHDAAAAVWDLARVPSGPIDVTTLRRSERIAGLRLHRSNVLDAVRRADGLPVTTVERTLADLAGRRDIARLCHRAAHLRILDAAVLRVAIENRPGAEAVRRALDELRGADPRITRSELEERFLALLEGAGLPRPEVNARVAGYEVDFLWREQCLVVETDGAATHLTRTAFERDRHRDADLTVAGYRVVRFTWADVVDRGASMRRTLSALLPTPASARRPRPPRRRACRT